MNPIRFGVVRFKRQQIREVVNQHRQVFPIWFYREQAIHLQRIVWE